MKLASLRNLPASPGFWGAVLLAAVISWASFYNLANYPVLWWDEAIFSETAANLAQHGRYAFTIQSPDQLSDLDFRISVGPAVIFPVALAYRLLGVGLVEGRLIAGFYLVFTFLALFLASRRLFGAGAAWFAVVLVLVGTDVIYWGRSVLGDIPALGLFLFGLCLLSRGLEQENPGWPLFLGGLFLGLAFDAKEFYGLAFLPPLAALIWQNRGTRPRLTWRIFLYILGVSLPLLFYLGLKAMILGGLSPAVWHFLEQKALLRHEFFTPLTIGRVYGESFRYLLTHPIFLVGLLGCGWLWRTGRLTLRRALWVGNFFLWTLVYCTAVYWHRFALPALFLAAPLAGLLICRVTARLTAGVPSPSRRWVNAGLVLGFCVWLVPICGLDYIRIMFHHQDHPPHRLVEFLQKRFSPRCLIETPEYEVAFLNDRHQVHLMPAFFFVESDDQGVELLNPRRRPYDFNQPGPDVLILGSFGKSVFAQIYPCSQVARHWRKVAQIDYYDIYVRRTGSLLKAESRGKRSGRRPPLIRKAKGPKVYEPNTLHRPYSD